MPYGIVLLLLHDRWLVGYIPLLRSMDITRIWWFSNIYLALGLGLSLDALRGGTLKPYLVKGMVAIALLLFGWRCLIQLRADPSDIPYGFPTAAVSTVALLVLVGSFLATRGRERLSVPLRVGIFLAILALFYPRYRACRYVTHYLRQGTERSLMFWHEEFIPLMKPLTRLASGGDPAPDSRDHRAAAYGILGSAGRSITLSKALRDAFDRRGLIEAGWNGLCYYFKPAPQTLAKFGIRYYIAERAEQVPRLVDTGWRHLLTVPRG